MADALQPEWQALTFGHKIYAIFRLPGASQWRYLKNKDGSKRTFITEREARAAAKSKAMDILFPKTTGTIDLDDRKVAETLGVEQWLQSKRADIKAAKTLHKPGRRQVVVVRGKVRA